MLRREDVNIQDDSYEFDLIREDIGEVKEIDTSSLFNFYLSIAIKLMKMEDKNKFQRVLRKLTNYIDENEFELYQPTRLGDLFYEAVRLEKLWAMECIYDFVDKKYDKNSLIKIIHGEFKNDIRENFISFRLACGAQNPAILELVLKKDLYSTFIHTFNVMLKNNGFEVFFNAVCENNENNIIQLINFANDLNVEWYKRFKNNPKSKKFDILPQMINDFQGKMKNKFCNLLLFYPDAFETIYENVPEDIKKIMVNGIVTELPEFANFENFKKDLLVVENLSQQDMIEADIPDFSEEEFCDSVKEILKNAYIILRPNHFQSFLSKEFTNRISTLSAAYTALRSVIYSVISEKAAINLILELNCKEINLEKELELYNKSKLELKSLESNCGLKVAYNWCWHLNQASGLFQVCKNPLEVLTNKIGCMDVIYNVMYFLNDEKYTPKIELVCNVLNNYQTSFSNAKLFKDKLIEERDSNNKRNENSMMEI